MITSKRPLIGAGVAMAITWAGAAGASAAPSLQDQRQAACYGDAQRLCGQYVPDVAKVTACMKPKKALVSKGCRALWDVKG